ncbi:amidase [Sinomonas sp. JGH33]|uniref:Amidase n=1 Tax=Sinomonas terricola TaxID=3110330 RepID=A0ABU5T907_9MICC|nr:amidase [Sinomonas sp. JGH33]MEA5455999.1 amidase [Sinomonas sp. JGH33]
MSEPWELGGAEAARMIREGALSAVELLDSVLGRVVATEGFARAWAHVDADGARAAARTADRIVRRGGGGPLVGVPLGVKDVIDVRGLPAEGGSAALRGRIAMRDAGAVRRLRDNGAVILGKLRTHEFAFGQGTPPTRNPWDPGRYAGGSSVGSGVAVAVGSVPAALGTDTGGSVRNPASVNGLVGLKPTSGLVPGSGVLTVSHTLDHIGPIARSAEDCALVLRGLASPAAAAAAPRTTTTARLAVDRGLWAPWGVAPDVRDIVDAAIGELARLGFEIVDVSLPELDLALPASLAISLSEASHHHRERLRTSADRYLPQTRTMIETGALVTSADLRLAHDVRTHLRTALAAFFERTGVDALLSPTLPVAAPRLESMAHELTGDADGESLSSALRMLSAANLTGLPAVSVPCGLAGGLPVGLHLLGPMFSDYALLEIAEAYERASPWQAMVPLRELPRLPVSAR